jgi:hypothetical protein
MAHPSAGRLDSAHRIHFPCTKRRRQRPESLASQSRCNRRPLDHSSSLRAIDSAPSLLGCCIFSCAGDGFSSFLASRILQRYQRWISRAPRISDPPVPPCDESSGVPDFPIFQLCRRSSPRVSPRSLTLGADWWSFESPRMSHLPAIPAIESRFPRISHPPAVPVPIFRVTPNPLLQRCQRCSFGLLRAPQSPVLPLPRLRVSPIPASAAGSTMTLRLDSNFASPA